MIQQYGASVAPSARPIDLSVHRTIPAIVITHLTHEQLSQLALPGATLPGPALKTPWLTLSARRPYDAAHGHIDVYRPGRWDASSNLIYMSPIIQVGPSVGEWEGTVVYASVTVPTSGKYLVVAYFSGYDTTMTLNGPWGAASAYTAVTSDTGVVLAHWVGGGLSFTIHCKGSGLGYLESIQVYHS